MDENFEVRGEKNERDRRKRLRGAGGNFRHPSSLSEKEWEGVDWRVLPGSEVIERR